MRRFLSFDAESFEVWGLTDTAKCPKCGAIVHMPVKSWDVKPKRGGATFHVSLYECPKCLKRWTEKRRLNAPPSNSRE